MEYPSKLLKLKQFKRKTSMGIDSRELTKIDVWIILSLKTENRKKEVNIWMIRHNFWRFIHSYNFKFRVKTSTSSFSCFIVWYEVEKKINEVEDFLIQAWLKNLNRKKEMNIWTIRQNFWRVIHSYNFKLRGKTSNSLFSFFTFYSLIVEKMH